MEDETEFGPLSRIFETFKSLFKYHGCLSYADLEDSIVFMIKMGNKLLNQIDPSAKLKKIDLLAKLDNSKTRNRAKPAVVALHIYITQKVSNAVAETLGRLSNIIREGVRMKMGMMYLEVYTRLHYLPPLESKEMSDFVEKVRKL